MTLNEYIYSGNAHYECELYVDGIKSNIDVNSITVSGTDSSVYVPFGNVFSRYITLNINGNMFDPGQQVFVRLIPDGFEAIDIGAFYVQGDPTASGDSYTFTAHDKLIYADIPVDFVELPEPALPTDPAAEYDESVSASPFYILEESAKYLGLECDFPEDNALWKAAENHGTGMFILTKRYVRAKLLNEGNPFWGSAQYDVNDLSKLSVKSVLQLVGLLTGTNFMVEARIENGKVVETLKACTSFSDGVKDDDGSFVTLDESSVVYAENEIEKKITSIVGTVETKYKKYDPAYIVYSSQVTQELNYSESERVDTYSSDDGTPMELELPITLTMLNQSILDSIHSVVDYARSFKNQFYRYSVSMVGDPRVRNGYIVQFAGGYKYYVGNITLNYDGGLKMDISSGSSENTSITMGSAGIASILEKVKGIEMNLNNTEKNAMSVEELNARIASFEYMKVDELEASVANIGSLTADSAIIQNIQAVALNADAIKAAVADIDVLTVSQADVKYASIDSLDALQGSFNALDAKAITTDNLSTKTAELGYLTATQADIKYASIDSIDALQGSFNALNAKAITTDNLSAKTAELGYMTATQADIKYASIDSIDALQGSFNALNAKAITTDNLSTKTAELGYLTATQADVKYASIDMANVSTATIGTVLAKVGLITSATIESGHVTGYLDSVSINANAIKAGTLSVDRLVINGTTNSIIYALNNAGDLTSTHCDTLDGGLLTKRTVTADHLVAGTITANEIAAGTITAAKIASGTITATQIASGTITATQIKSGTITAEKIASGTITATQIASGTITAEKINLTDLFSKNITASNMKITGGYFNVETDNIYTSSTAVFKITLKEYYDSTKSKYLGYRTYDMSSTNGLVMKSYSSSGVLQHEAKYGCSYMTVDSAGFNKVTANTYNSYVLADACSKGVDNYTSVGALMGLKSWTASTNLITRNTLAHWNGCYASTSSNLAYCVKGAFGNACTMAYSTSASSIASGGGYLPTGGAIYSYINNNLYNRLVDGHLSFKWIADTDGWAKLYIYIDTVLVAKIKQGTGL